MLDREVDARSDHTLDQSFAQNPALDSAVTSPPPAKERLLPERPKTFPALVEVEFGDTLAAMATRVYGRHSYTLLDLIQAANAAIEDPSRIIAGTMVVFPTLRPETRVILDAQGEYLVVSLTTPSLSQALSEQGRLQREHQQAVEIQTVSLYDGPELYRVYLPAFPTRAEAIAAASLLGPVLKK